MEITINGEYIDTGNAVIAISRQAYDFSDFEMRFLGRTNQFSVPRTNKNQEIFKRPQLVASSADSFERVYKATVIDQGVIVLKGNAIFTEAGQNYKIQVIDRAKELFDSLDAPLKDLDLESSDYEIAGSAYDDLKVVNETVWLWATEMQHISKNVNRTILNYASGAWFPDFKYTRTSFYIKRLIQEMLLQKGWSFEEFTSSEKFDAAIMSSNHEEFNVTSYQKTISQTINGDGTFYAATNMDILYDFKESSITFPENFTINIHSQKAAFRLRGAIEATGDFIIYITGTSTSGADNSTQTFNIYKGDTYIDITTDVFETDEADMKVRMGAIGDSGALTFVDTLYYNKIEENSFGDLSTSPLSGFLVKTHENLPDMTQKDLLKQVWSIFGIGIQIGQVEKKIYPFAYSEFSRSNAVDWSDKYITDSETVNLFNAQLGKSTFMTYSNDEFTEANEGRGVFEIDNDTLPETNTLVNSSFSASPQIVVEGNDVLVGAFFDMTYLPIYNDTERVNTLSPRIRLFRFNTFVDNGQLAFFDTFVQTAPSDSGEGISWAAQILNEYALVVPSLKRSREVVAYFNLNKLDVVGFDFAKLLYVEQLKSYFFVMPIGDYVPGRVTKCTLLKVN